ncbi:protein Star-like [Hyalella azteca]|uniref:Protein Star-like n=1 Tax=Hyalella azteca TaxID=294128 RepID=A0A8B7NEJ5_HYAAZ|nr:protein Star-like [Hyalella azteca]
MTVSLSNVFKRSYAVKGILFLSCIMLLSHINFYKPEKFVKMMSSKIVPPAYEDLVGLDADDPRLIDYIRQHVIVPPSTEPYNLHYGINHDPSDGQAKVVDELLNRKRNGFYIESGGFTGEVLSNTLFFEIKRNWTGILIEPNPKNFKKLLSRNRKAHSAKACIGEIEAAAKVVFVNRKDIGKIFNVQDSSNTGESLDLNNAICFPLYSFLLALGKTTVDYFSLDVESSEYKVLQSIPWDKVDIKTLSVEYNIIPEGKPALIDFMTSKGYIHYMELNRPYTHDLIFVKQEVLDHTRVSYRDLPILNSNNTYMWIKRTNFDS